MQAGLLTGLVLLISAAVSNSRGWAADPWSAPAPALTEVSQGEKKKGGEVVLETGLSQEDELDCFGRKCLASDQCCRGSACVDVDGSKLGTCLPVYGQREGEQCQQDSDCERGLACLLPRAPAGTRRSCQLRTRELRKKQFSDECQSSDECDVSRGLCCQLQRRHRMAPRKLCFYFADPKSCIGTVPPAAAAAMNDFYRPSYRPYKSMSFFHNPLFKARMG
ncbi:prohormone-3-like [Ixodes scapularis]|uniref:prohormone-3-like n=1 Tax=Ixodes scapularis TaxID=6945 RepID=UPI001AD7758F|nr:prohormone-3-like [Ixodes scapularis]